ncbi:MAG TPA: hypothetical protein VI251_01735 [Pseudolabrys sp.]|jgi:hypothetical protein
MRIPVVAGFVMLWALSPAHDAAKAGNFAPWCYRHFGATTQYTDCNYYSAHQCFLMARYSLDGGICERNNGPLPPVPTRKTERQRRY